MDMAGDEVPTESTLEQAARRIASGECPSATVLAAYHAGALSRTSDELVIKHLAAGCPTCVEAILEPVLEGGEGEEL